MLISIIIVALMTTKKPKMNDTRLDLLRQWLNNLGIFQYQIEPASADASFRRYFRVTTEDESRIVMDAPPDKESCHPFIDIAESFAALGLNVPRILARDLEQGFLMLTDLGSTQYLSVLNAETVDRLYGDALGALAILQACGPGTVELPPYDEPLLLREMELFREWFLQKHLGLALATEQHKVLDETFSFLAQSALEQPRVAVHRDYHSRNLMFTPTHNPGVLDFQDAVLGPVTYDLVSLLRDCYIRWPREQVEEWVRGYHELALQSGILREENEAQFLRWFDLMGAQRHLKAIGIFARLNHRDHKSGYLQDIPRTLSYLREVAAGYLELHDFASQILDKIQVKQ